ncbi:Uncharacterised protein [uncultured archaeon]|nr:Uncharacterised protein [uncultured archaeon]
MSKDGAIKTIMRIAPRPKRSTQKRMCACSRENSFREGLSACTGYIVTATIDVLMLGEAKEI